MLCHVTNFKEGDLNVPHRTTTVYAPHDDRSSVHLTGTDLGAKQAGRAAYRMVYVEESPARGQLVVLFNLLDTSDRQEHADRRAEGEEICRLKVQRVVDN